MKKLLLVLLLATRLYASQENNQLPQLNLGLFHQNTSKDLDEDINSFLTKIEHELNEDDDESEREYSEDESDFINKRKKTTDTGSNATLTQTASSLTAQQSITNPIDYTTAALTKTNTTQPNIKEKSFKCSQCNYSNADKRNFIRHLRIHTGEKSHQCIQCDQRFAHKQTLTRHMKATHKDKKSNDSKHVEDPSNPDYHLDFLNKYTLEELNVLLLGLDSTDLASHQPTTEHISISERSSINPKNIEEDIDSLLAKIDHELNEDKDKSKTISSLSASQSTTNSIDHTTTALNSKTNTEQTNTKEKPHQCTQYNQRFSYKSYLTKHTQAIHTEKKSFKCSQCDQYFSYKQNLNTHRKIVHDKEKPFKCTKEGCNYSTGRASDLKKHIRTHTGERPYQCTECDKHFSKKQNLTKHMRTHTGEKPHQCTHEGCNYSTDYKHVLITHMKRIHQNEESDDSEHEEDPSN